jgi:transposase-like protein
VTLNANLNIFDVHVLNICQTMFVGKSTNMFQVKNQMEFNRLFQTEDDCYKYLESVKWAEGFKCSKCGNKTCRSGNKMYDRRCLQCSYHESLTNNTLFHNLKFSILKAFHIVYHLTYKKGLSTYEIAKHYGICQKTAWLFKRKVQDSFSNQGPRLTGKVEADEFSIGGKSKGQQGRSLGQKKPALIMIEKMRSDENQKEIIGNVKIVQIKDYKMSTIKPILESNVSNEAIITTDKFSTYKGLKKSMKNLKTKYSKNGKSFKALHNVIINIKSWIRGIHHKISEFHFQNYLDEYVFRINNRNSESTMFQSVIYKMVNSPKKSAQCLRQLAT